MRCVWTETPKQGSMSIYSTDLYRGVIISIFRDQSIGLIATDLYRGVIIPIFGLPVIVFQRAVPALGEGLLMTDQNHH